jgi:hypothetical protein
MDVSGLMAVSDEMMGFKKFLDHEGLQYPLFISLYSNDDKITFDITPIVRKTYNWVYNRLVSEINKGSDNSFPVLQHVGKGMYEEYLSEEFGSESVIVRASYYGDNSKIDMEYAKDITDWLFIVFERIGDYLKNELYNMCKNLFDGIKYVSNSLHTLKVF